MPKNVTIEKRGFLTIITNHDAKPTTVRKEREELMTEKNSKHLKVVEPKMSATENKPYIEAMLDLRRSSASAPHTLKKNKGTRRAQKNKAIRDSMDNY